MKTICTKDIVPIDFKSRENLVQSSLQIKGIVLIDL